MKCNIVEEHIIDFIENTLSEDMKDKIQSHVTICPKCQKETEQMRELLGVMDEVTMELPSKNLQLRFEQALEKEKTTTKTVSLQARNNRNILLRVAASVVIVIGAYFIGKHQSNKYHQELLAQQKIEKQNNLLALLENQSASKRIEAVGNAESYTQADTKIIEAIINKLNTDKNINVRLAAAEALYKFSSLEMVRTALIKALETEKEAIVQIELIQILAKIQEKRALKPMQKLLQNKETPTYVKQELQYNLPSLL